MNLLAKYCRFCSSDSIKDDSLGAIIQGLCSVYEKHNQLDSLSPHPDATAFENPLINNRYLVLLRRAYGDHLAKYRDLSFKSIPIAADLVCYHAAKF